MKREPGPDLFTSVREHDLPPLWDGLAVVWEPWTNLLGGDAFARVFICPRPPKPECCGACGSLTPAVHARGYVARVPAVSHDRIREVDAARARLPIKARHHVAPKALLRLFAFRCPDCRHDVVHDITTDEMWDLEPSDYGDVGSDRP